MSKKTYVFLYISKISCNFAGRLRQAGGTASVTKTSDADEDACYSHDQN